MSSSSHTLGGPSTSDTHGNLQSSLPTEPGVPTASREMSFVEALFHRNQKATLDLFTQLAQERDALERVARTSSIQQATQASHTRALMSAIAECTERQSTMERSIHAILGRRAEGEKRLREGIIEMFRVKEQHDRRLQHEIDDLFAASADILLQVRKIADGLSGIAADPPKSDMTDSTLRVRTVSPMISLHGFQRAHATSPAGEIPPATEMSPTGETPLRPKTPFANRSTPPPETESVLRGRQTSRSLTSSHAPSVSNSRVWEAAPGPRTDARRRSHSRASSVHSDVSYGEVLVSHAGLLGPDPDAYYPDAYPPAVSLPSNSPPRVQIDLPSPTSNIEHAQPQLNGDHYSFVTDSDDTSSLGSLVDTEHESTPPTIRLRSPSHPRTPVWHLNFDVAPQLREVPPAYSLSPSRPLSPEPTNIVHPSPGRTINAQIADAGRQVYLPYTPLDSHSSAEVLMPPRVPTLRRVPTPRLPTPTPTPSLRSSIVDTQERPPTAQPVSGATRSSSHIDVPSESTVLSSSRLVPSVDSFRTYSEVSASVNGHEDGEEITLTPALQRASRTLSLLQAYFEMLKRRFMLPRSVDIGCATWTLQHDAARVTSASVISALRVLEEKRVPEHERGKLSFTPLNEPVHRYIEDLDRLVVHLDAVQCENDAAVKGVRKQVVDMVMGEIAAVERWINLMCTTATARDCLGDFF